VLGVSRDYCLHPKCDWVTTGHPCIFPCMVPQRRVLASERKLTNEDIAKQVHNRERMRRMVEEERDAGLSAT
jgi:hypothetical protein